MRPVSMSAIIDAPREAVFEYLCDIANHAEFTGHFLEDFRLERLDSRGIGAAATFRVAFPLGALWAEVVIVDVERPHRIALDGRAGRIGRIAVEATYLLTRHDHAMTRVELTVSTNPATRADALREALGGRLWLKSQCGRALRSLKAIFEEGEPSTHAVRVAAG